MIAVTAGQLWEFAVAIALGLGAIWLIIEKGLGWLVRRYPARRPAAAAPPPPAPPAGSPGTVLVLHACGCATSPCPPHAARTRHPSARAPRADWQRWENEIGRHRP